MKSICARVAAMLAVATGTCVFSTSYALPPLDTPYQQLAFYGFDNVVGSPRDWDANVGVWFASDGTYRTADPRSISTINSYFSDPFSQEYRFEPRDDYVYRVRMMTLNEGAENRFGFVYNYQDPANYYELVFSPTDIVQVRRVIAGVTSVVFQSTYPEGGKNRWVDAALYATGTKMRLVVNGNNLVTGLEQAELPKGRLGLVAYGGGAIFDNVKIDMPTDAPIRETFNDGLAQQFPQGVDSNNWKIENGVLKNFTVMQTNRIAVARHAGWFAQSDILHVKLRNPYGASGNLVGVYFSDGHIEVVFSRTGFVRLDAVNDDGTRTNIASAAIPKLSSDWFDVVVDDGVFTEVSVNGSKVLSYLNGPGNHSGTLGLVTHWAPGEFDLVDFNDEFMTGPYVQSFSSTPSATVVSGTWTASGGTYNSTAGGTSDVSALVASPTQPFAPERSMDFSYRARVLTPALPQQSVGLVTHFSSPGDYYEVLLTGGGQIFLNKHVAGTVVREWTSRYTAAPNTWVTLELRCVSNKTSVFLNGSTKISGVLQGQLRDGSAGLITHSSPGKFDDVVFAEIN